jgi:hypothetical protein
MSFATKIKWGHALSILDLDGKEIRQIRVPNEAFSLLHEIGHLNRRRHAVYEGALLVTLRDQRLDPIVLKLRQLLGVDLMGPAWCVCNCRNCRRRYRKAEKEVVVETMDTNVVTRLVNELKAKRVYK